MSETFKITFFNHNSVYEIYSKEVYQSDMYGFIVVENIVFGENTSLVVDPSEEKLKTCLLYTSPSPRDGLLSRMPSSA